MVAAVDDGAAWAPAVSAAAVDAPRRTYRLLPHCWVTVRARGPPVPAVAAEILGSTRSKTIAGITARDRVASGQTFLS